MGAEKEREREKEDVGNSPGAEDTGLPNNAP
jgi:hypothetical protein